MSSSALSDRISYTFKGPQSTWLGGDFRQPSICRRGQFVQKRVPLLPSHSGFDTCGILVALSVIRRGQVVQNPFAAYQSYPIYSMTYHRALGTLRADVPVPH